MAKLTVRAYSEPLDIDIEDAAGNHVATLDFKADFRDTTLFKAIDMYKATQSAQEALAAIEGDEIGEAGVSALKGIADSIQPFLDLVLGDGAFDRIVAAFGEGYEPADCAVTLTYIWRAVGDMCVERAGMRRVKAAERYLDAQA